MTQALYAHMNNKNKTKQNKTKKQTVFLQEMSTDRGSFRISTLCIIAGDYQGK
jgi:hypothetical protein